ncbi:MAG: hypothetical protein ABUK01_12670 [Leptospirales bacterium]
MVNRCAIILKYQEPFLQWLDKCNPDSENSEIEDENAESEGTVYLISVEDGEFLDRWLDLNYETLFKNELNAWYTDESLWPEKRNRKAFNEWFRVDFHSIVSDTAGGEIYDDEMEESSS